jgi:hypothetical protein
MDNDNLYKLRRGKGSALIHLPIESFKYHLSK